MKINKLIRNGEVAVLISSNFGAGWSTWNTEIAEFLLFDSKLVKLFEKKDYDGIKKYLKNKFPEGISLPGMRDVEILWVPIGTSFIVEEYDGNETFIPLSDLPIYTT